MARARPAELFPLFRSDLQGKVLAYTLMSPDRERTASEIAKGVAAPLSSVSRELDRLTRAGLLADRRLGRTRLVTPNPQAPLLRATTELALHTFGPRFIIADEFDELAGADEVWIFGSWAARYQGQAGLPPGDIDVLVVGRPDRSSMYEATDRAEARIGKPVNVTVRSRRAWRNDPDRFVEQLREGPLVSIVSPVGALS